MTLDELTAAEMTANAEAGAAELADTIVANGDKLDGTPTDPTDTLIRKIVEVAEKDGVTCHAVNVGKHDAFTYEDRVRCSPAIKDRAERMRVEMTKETIEKAKAQTIYPIRKRQDGKWWIGDGEDAMGPYDTKKEAVEDRSGLISSSKLAPDEVVTGRKADASEASGKQKKKAKRPEPSPIASPPESSEDANEIEPVNPTVSESETEMKTDSPTKSKKKTKGTSAKAANGGAKSKPAKPAKAKGEKAAKPAKGDKPAKAPKAPKTAKAKDGKLGCLDAAYEVLKGRTNPMTIKQMIEVMEERGLWKGDGKTPVQTLSGAVQREIKLKGKESRFEKVDRGLFSAVKH